MTLPDWLKVLLNSSWLPLVLLLGAFGDAFILTSLFIFGEVIFVGAGYAMASTHNYYFLPVIWLGATSGDIVSYFIGRRYGPSIVTRWIKKRAKWRLNFLRAKRMLRRRGIVTVFSARLAGPISKFMPFIAGSLIMPFSHFLPASIAGVIVGTAQFVLSGWLLAKGLESRHLWQQYWHGYYLYIALAILFIIVILWYWRKNQSNIESKN